MRTWTISDVADPKDNSIFRSYRRQHAAMEIVTFGFPSDGPQPPSKRRNVMAYAHGRSLAVSADVFAAFDGDPDDEADRLAEMLAPIVLAYTVQPEPSNPARHEPTQPVVMVRVDGSIAKGKEAA